MKIKIDFVTNSSCASFVILKENITNLQKFLIKNHTAAANEYLGRNLDNLEPWDWTNRDGWDIEETETEIKGDTTMDNFDMLWFLTVIGVKDEDIEYKGCY